MRILAVDDDPIILELLKQFVTVFANHELQTASSGIEALELMQGPDAPQIDCFMLDIQMPRMDGIELCQALRKMEAHTNTPVVMLTAMSEKRYIDAAFAAGATDYATKPFDVTELKARIAMIDELVKSRAPKTSKIFAAQALHDQQDPQDMPLELHTPILLNDVDNVIECTAMENYVAQLSRNSLFGSTVFAFTLRKVEGFHSTLSPAEFRFLIEDIAEVISDTLSEHQFLMTYAGSGTFVCITESGWRPDMTQLCDHVNLYLSRAQILCNDGTELHPRVSAGAAIRLVWKSGEQILNALGQAQASAEEAAIEYERLKNDFFQFGRTA
ncbi:response regulator [Sulfitobacter albidus]|uniref:Response regulator n=1 Tax=Sulfitobacter albidus TaxID=2829501 RepID=A0A975PMH0_9RHOB|nr:response regulator [Sulfitobacter albidus]QUJ76714.1 response regulator [Sulfitobacter albidus]